LLVITMEAAGISRSLKRIEHEERRLVTHCVAERPMTLFRTLLLLERFQYNPPERR
jgi:hypothetical protein